MVSTTSVDKYLESRKLSGLDFIKVDVEGAEDDVISGVIQTSIKDWLTR
jgi:FkbM family methyltransferase